MAIAIWMVIENKGRHYGLLQDSVRATDLVSVAYFGAKD
jgi:hypothetical protein